MRLKQMFAGILAGAMVVTSLPSAGLGGITAWAESGVVNTDPVRYRSIPSEEMTISADFVTRDTAPLENALSDAANFALSRYNTGGIPRSSMLTARNNIYVKLDEAASITKLVWWPNEDQSSGGHGENVHNGTVTRLKVSYTTEDLSAKTDAAGMAGVNWVTQENDVRFDSSENDNNQDQYGMVGIAHDINLKDYFDSVPANITGVRLEILNTAGVYDLNHDDRDTYISGKELQLYANNTSVDSGKLTAFVDFACENAETSGTGGSDNLVDGKLDTVMQSVRGESADASDNSAQGPVKTDSEEYFANNNIYLDLSKTRQIGKLTYVSGTSVGSIQRCNIYVSNAQLGENQTPEDITDWELAYTNVPEIPEDGSEVDASKDWSVYNPQANANGNSHEAVFAPDSARYVRIEVKNTAGTRTQFKNKWINIGRLYVYDAETVYTGTEENVALQSEGADVVAYTGRSGSQDSAPNIVLAGTHNNTSDDNNKWLGGVNLKNGETATGNVDYLIIDLGENVSVRNLSSIKLRWHNRAAACSYQIETADDISGEVLGDVTETLGSEIKATSISHDPDVWTEVAEFAGRDRDTAPNPTFPLDVFEGEQLQTNMLKRYVRILITDMYKSAAYNIPGLRAVEIWGVRETGRLNTVELDLDVPVYHGVLRAPGTQESTRYHLDSFEYYKKGETTPLDKTTDKFEAGTYVLEAKVGTLLPFGDQMQATVNGESADIELTDENCSCGLGGKLVKVTYEFTIEDPTEAREALRTLLSEEGITAAINSGNRDEDSKLIYTARSWERLNKAYSVASNMIEFKLDPSPGTSEDPTRKDPDSSEGDTQEVWYLKSQYEAAATELQNAYKALRRMGSGNEIDMDDEPLDVKVTPPAHGESPADAVLSNPGSIEVDTLSLVKGDDFRVDDDGYIHGTVTAPDSDPANEVFQIQGTTNFMIYFKTIIPEKPTGKQSIVGRFNDGYGVQLETNSNGSVNLLAYGYGENENYWASDTTLHRIWPTTKMTLPNDWYGTEHTVVVIFNGNFFDLYVDGVQATDVQTHNWRKEDGTYEVSVDSSPLAFSDKAAFSIGFNVQDKNEYFSGGLKDFSMYIGENCPDYSGFSSAAAESPSAFETALETALEDETADLALTGSVTKYQLYSTEWKEVGAQNPMGAGETFDRYKDYEVTITAQTTPGYFFPDAADDHVVLRTTEGELSDYTAILNEDGTEITITYVFKGEAHPYDVLSDYLDTLTIDGITDNQTNEGADGERVFTKESWNNYQSKYDAAKTLVDAGKDESKLDEYISAKSALETAATIGEEGGLLLAAENCECVLGEITFEDGNIVLDDVSAQKTLEASCVVDHSDCMKHQTAPTADVTYTISEENTTNTAGATIEGEDVLTVTTEGSVEVTATVTLMDGERTVGEKTKSATFTVGSTAVTDREGSAQQLDDTISQLETALEALDPDKYTKDSWDALQQVIEDAKALSTKLKDTTDRVTVNELQGQLAKLTLESLVLKGDTEEDSVQDLLDLLQEILALNQEDYTAASWSAMEDIYNQAAEYINSTENPDPETCKGYLDQLRPLKAALKTTAQDLEDAAQEVNDKVAAAEPVYTAGQKNYSKATWDAFIAAYNAAKNPPAGATADDLRLLARTLAEAQAALTEVISTTTPPTTTPPTTTPPTTQGTEALKNGDSQIYKDVEYRVLNASAKTAVAYKGQKKKAKSVVIASTVNIKGVSCKVVQISANAFKGYTKMTKLTIGKNVTTIGKKAFMNCSKLKTIKLQSKVLKKIQNNAFKNVKNKVKVKWPNGLKAKKKNTLKKSFKNAKLTVK